MVVFRYPDETAGQIPMAFIVRQAGKELTEDEIMDWVAKQVLSSSTLNCSVRHCVVIGARYSQ